MLWMVLIEVKIDSLICSSNVVKRKQLSTRYVFAWHRYGTGWWNSIQAWGLKNMAAIQQTTFQAWGLKNMAAIQQTTFQAWGLNNMAAIKLTTCSNSFSWIKMLRFRLNVHWLLAPSSRQAITWWPNALNHICVNTHQCVNLMQASLFITHLLKVTPIIRYNTVLRIALQQHITISYF